MVGEIIYVVELEYGAMMPVLNMRTFCGAVLSTSLNISKLKTVVRAFNVYGHI